jgi:hypothetical protein
MSYKDLIKSLTPGLWHAGRVKQESMAIDIHLSRLDRAAAFGH